MNQINIVLSHLTTHQHLRTFFGTARATLYGNDCSRFRLHIENSILPSRNPSDIKFPFLFMIHSDIIFLFLFLFLFPMLYPVLWLKTYEPKLKLQHPSPIVACDQSSTESDCKPLCQSSIMITDQHTTDSDCNTHCQSSIVISLLQRATTTPIATC